MISDAPEFHTQHTLSPLSPLPIHPSEPTSIPVLRNQMDPTFNMTATHINPDESLHAVNATADAVVHAQDPEFVDEFASSDSSPSDTHGQEGQGEESKETEHIDEGPEDDYTMTFESWEEDSDAQDVTHAKNEPEIPSLPTSHLASLLTATMTGLSDPTVGASNTGQEHNATSSESASKSITAPDDAVSAQISGTDQLSSENAPNQTHRQDEGPNEGIDIQQLLDNITANAEKIDNTAVLPHLSANTPNYAFPNGGSALPAHASLPPRPQVIQQPHSNYPQPDDSQNYFSGSQGSMLSASSYRPAGMTPSLVAAGAPGTSTDPRSGLPPPPSVSFPPPPAIASPVDSSSNSQMTRAAGQEQARRSSERADEIDDSERPWGPGLQKLYDEFLAEERQNVSEGLWDKFPAGSRLFIGNLPTEKVTKRDLFHIFHKYGLLAQISLKQAYGFVQFHDTASCYRALDLEQGQEVRGRRMHLEISKPQKNTRNQKSSNAQGQKTRSPDRRRGGASQDYGRQGQGAGRGGDRYDGRSAGSGRGGDIGRPGRSRDDYRPGRSPSPQREFRERADYGFSRGRDSYDGRDRRRSRSRSPYGQRDNGRYRERSLSPRSREANEDADLPLPRRAGHEVPDAQFILMDQLDRGFVSWAEGEFLARGLKVEIMILSPRLPLPAVIRRQIIEGVLAVSQLDMRSQNSSRMSLQIFDRQAGADKVRFDEYQDLEPKIAAELVLRAKNTVAPNPSYAQPQYPQGQSYQPQGPPAGAPNLANLVGQLDNATLQKLLGSLSVPQQQQNIPAVAPNPQIDLASLLAGFQQPTQQHHQPQPAGDPYAGLLANPALASLLGGNPQQPQNAPHQSAQQVQNIMAQLAKFRQ